MAASSVVVNLPWEGLFNELRNLEQASRPSKVPEDPLELKQRSHPVFNHLSSFPLILDKAAEAIRAAQSHAETLEQHVAAVLASSNAQVQAAEAASKALERDARDANERIHALELREKTADERVRALEARLEGARRALGCCSVDGKPSFQFDLISIDGC